MTSKRASERASAKVVAALHERYLGGEEVADLAAEISYSTTGLYWRFRNADLRMLRANRVKFTVNHPRSKKAIELWDNGMGLKAVCDKLHMGQVTAQRILREAGRNPGERRFGKHHHMWKGGRSLTNHGYALVLVPLDSPFRAMQCHKGGYVLEHRLVMAKHLERLLRRDETVHHINGVRTDNRLENLQLRSSDHGPGAAWRCADCGSSNLEPEPLQTNS